MEGPYRDLGSGFARLGGSEEARRSPSRITSVEAALYELLRNARDANARNIYVASTLHRNRYRTLAVIDDGCGVPGAYREKIFEPGVTTRHLDPSYDAGTPHGAGLSLYHIKDAALRAELTSPSSPTAIVVTFDTRSLPERSLQSESRPSRTNLLATAQNFLSSEPHTGSSPSLYFSSPARILALLLDKRIIQMREARRIRARAEELGINVSTRTVQRILKGEVRAARRISRAGGTEEEDRKRSKRSANNVDVGGVSIELGERELSQIESILERAARASYARLGSVKLRSRPGRLILEASVYEPEEEYD